MNERCDANKVVASSLPVGADMRRAGHHCRSSIKRITIARCFSESVKISTSRLPQDGKNLGDFIRPNVDASHSSDQAVLPHYPLHPVVGPPKTFHIETYGCQMNISDSEVVRSIMTGAGYHWTESGQDADVVLLNTCAIRENAEKRIWGRLGGLKGIMRQQRKDKVVGLLGCMAERLKTKLLEEEIVDVVAGPDAYRDLPRLLSLVEGGQKSSNVQLSHDETYADIKPVRISKDNVSAFVSIMRGCNNMCSYCIVPFTRGRERSRPVQSIVDEVRRLSEAGVKEVVLLGQNVNSYHDRQEQDVVGASPYETSEGFTNMYKARDAPGPRFVDLLDQVSRVDPDMRIRFTSPHPKDFPLGLLQLIAERPNVCRSIHLPAQSGSTSMLKRMRRGYSREAYLALVERVRSVIPGVSISSDFISGFCGETEEEHADTISLMEAVRFDQAFMYAYSLRERTHAAYHMRDDVPEEVKQKRLEQVIATFRRIVDETNRTTEVGASHLVLIEGPSKRSKPGQPTLTGRTDTSKRFILPDVPVQADISGVTGSGALVNLKAGDYVMARVTDARSQTLVGEPVGRTSIRAWHELELVHACSSLEASLA